MGAGWEEGPLALGESAGLSVSASLSEEVACLLRRFLPASGFGSGVPSSPNCSPAIAGQIQDARPCLAISTRGMLGDRYVLTFSCTKSWI